MGIAEGLLRIMPGWETHIFGTTWSWNVMIPGQIAPFALLTVVLAWPFLEAWVTGDKREHHLLQRPRNAPTRTAFLVSAATFYGLLWAAGGNDILAVVFSLNLNYITYFMRVAIFILPVIAFILTRRWCISLQRHDNEKLLHGYETGVIMRSPEGGYSERHLPINDEEAYTLTARDRDEVLPEPYRNDAYGVREKGYGIRKARARLSQWMFGDNVQKPTSEELEEGHHHAAAEHAHEVEAHMDVPADGHQFDGRHGIDEGTLRH
jgi:ubiquinol-cytochrome c reductase cytochrome b subunit